MEITQEQFEKAKENAFKHYEKHRIVKSPIFGEVRIKMKGLEHIEWDIPNHKRPLMEAYIRYLCFLHFDYIIKNSHLYQDYMERMEKVKIKSRKGKLIYVNRLVKYYGLISIVNHNKQRVKVIVKKTEGFNKVEYISVIPCWKQTKYGPQLFIEDFEP